MDMRITLLLLVLGASLCVASRKKRSALTLEKLTKRDEADLCSIREDDGSLPYYAADCDGGATCIFTSWICDGEADCEDEADEKPNRECPTSEDLCYLIPETGVIPYDLRVCEDQSRCYKDTQECDDAVDCIDGSDEANCGEEINLCDYIGQPDLGDFIFYCKNGDECIVADWLCDDEEDCSDGSDEKKAYCNALMKDTQGYRGGRKK